MNLIQQFDALVKSGVTVHLTLRADGENIRLDILPVAGESKTAIKLPPRALIGTAAELDASLPTFLPSYVSTASTINDQIAKANAELAEAQVEAAEQAKKAQTERAAAAAAKSKQPAKVGGAGKASEKKRDLSAGMLSDPDFGVGSTADAGAVPASESVEQTTEHASSVAALSSDLF